VVGLRRVELLVARVCGGEMTSICYLCKATAEHGKRQNLIEYGNCQHIEHLQCATTRAKSNGNIMSISCTQCHADRNKDSTSTNDDTTYLLGVYADTEYLRGVGWKKWTRRVRNAPVDFLTSLETSPISKPQGGLPLPKEQEMKVIPVDVKQLVMNGHEEESRTQGMVRLTVDQKRRGMDILGNLANHKYSVETLKNLDISFQFMNQYIRMKDGKPCTFRVWMEKTNLSPRELVELGARFVDLRGCGLVWENANGTLVAPSVYVGAPLYTKYDEVLKELCDNNWKKFFRIKYNPTTLKSMGLTLDVLMNCETFGWMDFRFLQYLTLCGVCEWGFRSKTLQAIYEKKYDGDLSLGHFGAHFCGQVMRWTSADCAKYLGIRFKA